jgi:hypothetical protein
MAPLNDMSAPGTASYSSDTMEVGDGTWDFTKNDFLLPNLVGLNFETMQYNGEYPSGMPELQLHFLARTPTQSLTPPPSPIQAWAIVSRLSRSTTHSLKPTA